MPTVRLTMLPLAVLVVAAVTSLLPAGPAPSPSGEEIARKVRELGDNRFTTREQASKYLWDAGRAAEPALREAVKSADPEVVRRSRELLDKFKWGIYPDTPKDVLGLIEQYRSGEPNARQKVINTLFERGSAGCAILLKLASAEDNAEARQLLLQQISAEAARAMPAVLMEGKFTALEDLLEVSLASKGELALPNYAAYWLLRGRIDEKINQLREAVEATGPQRLPEADARNKYEILAYLHRAKGDLKEARLAAEKAGKADLVTAILFEHGDWKELAHRAVGTTDVASIETLGLKAAYQRLAGQSEDFEKTLADSRKLVPDRIEDDGELWLTLKAFFLNDRPDEALALLVKSKNAATAFELLCAQMKYREAFELADKVKAAASKKLTDEAKDAGDRELLDLELCKARVLYNNLGEKEKALQHLARLVKSLQDADDPSGFETLIETEIRLRLQDQAFEHCAQLLKRFKGQNVGARLLGRVFPRDTAAAELACWALRGGESADELGDLATLKRMRDLFEGKMDRKALTRLIEVNGPTLPNARNEREIIEKWHQMLADSSRAAGMDDLVKTCLEKAATSGGSAASLIRLADFEAEKKQWKEAAEHYRQAWEKDKSQPVPLYLRGWALAKAGREAEGRELTDLAHWLPLGNESLRHKLGEALVKHGLTEAARAHFDLIPRLGRVETWEYNDVMRRRANEALRKHDYLRAADGYERILLSCLRANTFFTENLAYIFVPAVVHRHRAHGLLLAGQIEQANREAQAVLAALPGDIDLAIQTVPVLEQRGEKAYADKLYAQVGGRYQELCKAYPRSSWGHNSLAWLSVCCHRDLDAALDHARKAVELMPANPSYRDTLGEVYFQRGDKEKAIEAAKKCVELDAKNAYFRKQLRRIEAGDPKAALPDAEDED